MKYVGIIALILLIPLWIVLYAVAWIGAVAHTLFDALYQPLYDLSGKPLDKK